MASSSSSSSASSSSSDSEVEQKKVAPTKVAQKAPASSSSSSSSSDSETEPTPVKRSGSELQSESSKKAKTTYAVFIGGIPYDTTEDGLREHFEGCGEIVSIRMPTFPDSGRSRGLAFIDFADEDGVDKALAFDGTDFGGRYLKVSISTGAPKTSSEAPKRNFAQSEKPANCKTIFIGGLSRDATEDDIRSVFHNCGTISSARIAWDREQDCSKGFGYIDFDNEESVENAIKLTGTSICGRSIRVDYSAPREFGGSRGGPRGGSRGGSRGGPRGGSRGGSRGGMSSFAGKRMTFD